MLLSLLGSWLFGSLWLLSLLGLGLLCLLDLLWLSNLDELVRSSSLARSTGHLQSSLSNSPLESKPDLGGSLSSIHLVVGHDVIEDGSTAGTSPVLEGSDGSS